MQPLEKMLRNDLESTVKEARQIAEAAAQAALEQLGVGESAAFSHLTEDERDLRRLLRVHGRQLGDLRDIRTETQEIQRLVEEVAYEHWHRMLFARFLAENNLLMYPDPVEPVSVTLEECEDLAVDEGVRNGWELASRYAAHMLPQIFRTDSPVFRLDLPPEHQQKLERLVSDLPLAVFTASDAPGWVYQFWQAQKKDEVNASEVKIGARELPAVTQLFTEPYMVAFLLDNSLGAWWAVRRLTEDDLRNTQSEEELRRKAALPGMPLEYLRFVRQEDGLWTPAAGTFDRWPEHLRQLKALDPCCGSGHFLVAALMMLVAIRRELEGLSPRDAVDAVLRENIHGLELDQRCVELAAFALALTAWRYPDAGGYRRLPELHVACSGLSMSVSRDEWRKLAGNDQGLRIALDWLYDEFENAPVLGSLLNPSNRKTALFVDQKTLASTLRKGLDGEHSVEEQEAGVVAYGLAKAAALLADNYHWIITNVPYLARGKQSEDLRDFCEAHYPEAKNDLATVFLDRCLGFCVEGGTASIVLPQNWLFLTSYRKFREKLLRNETWHLIARLGPGAFETISGEVVQAILITLSRGNRAAETEGLWSQLGNGTAASISGLDVSEPRTTAEKAVQLVTGEIRQVEQKRQLENSDARVILEETAESEILGTYAESAHGITTFDTPRFILSLWEVSRFEPQWLYCQSTVETTNHFGGRSTIIRWENEAGGLVELMNAKKAQGYTSGVWKAGQQVWGNRGVVVSLMRDLSVTRYLGDPFDANTGVIVPFDPTHVEPIYTFCSSPEFNELVRHMDQSLKVTNATLVKVPFDLEHWTQVAAEKYPNGLPEPYSDDPTQWLFHGHPATSSEPLQVAVARLLGYRWPAELDLDMELSGEARAWVEKSKALLPYADTDGIVCIPPVRGEASAADRLHNLLVVAYGDSWEQGTLTTLLQQADHAGKTLETWLRDRFFTQHIRLFQNRPFVWHIWDGLRDGFAALVNYHKLDRKNLETLIYTYLGDWINRQKQDQVNGVDGAEEKLAAAENLKRRLELILEGEAPYDIFVRWKPLAEQPIGWDPDLNDGVRLNIRPFLSVPDVDKKGAGVLRDKPNIQWTKDRGKDVESAPWYPPFKGDRINDHHLTLQEKRSARQQRR